jgi:IclR family transcriptional regulator, KDG regulon repressor
MSDPGRRPNYNIAVVDRTIDLLEALADAPEPPSVTEIAQAIGATKSATFRILATLEGRGYVSRDSETGKYQLGMPLVRLGQRSLESIDLRTIARPILEDLHDQFNETVNLGVMDNFRITYVDMIESDLGLRMSARVGAQDYAHSTAIGKAILAFCPDSRVEEYLSRPLEQRTARTITDPDKLRQELRRIGRSGFSRERGENEEGASCFGAPIFDHRGRVIAAVSISGPDSRVAGEKAEDIAVAIRIAAQVITSRVGGKQPSNPLEGSGAVNQAAG